MSENSMKYSCSADHPMLRLISNQKKRLACDNTVLFMQNQKGGDTMSQDLTMEDLRATRNNLSADMQDMKTRLGSIETGVDSIESKVGDMGTRVSDIEEKAQDMKTKVDDQTKKLNDQFDRSEERRVGKE